MAKTGSRIELVFFEALPVDPDAGFSLSIPAMVPSREETRTCFYLENDHWKAYRSDWDEGQLDTAKLFFSGIRIWDAVEKGQVIGKVTSQDKEWREGRLDVGTQAVRTGADVFNSQRDKLVIYYCWPVKVLKPMTLVSAGINNVSKKAQWRVSSPRDVGEPSLRSILEGCIDKKGIGAEYNKDANTHDFKITAVYEQGARYLCCAIRFSERSNVWDNAGDPDRSLYWFGIDREHDTLCLFLGAHLILIDWGDYNSDGFCDLLFMISFRNGFGYKIVDSGFTVAPEFLIHFH